MAIQQSPEQAAQIKNLFFLFKRADFTDAQFNDYWLKHHTHLAQQVDPSIHKIIVPNYYQDPERSNGYGSALVETYHPDEAALQRLFGEPAFNTLIEDEPNFVRPEAPPPAEWKSSTKLVATTEEVVVDRGDKPAFGKLMVFIKGRDGGPDREGRLARWRGAARDKARAVPEVVGYVESTPMETGRSSATQGAAQEFLDVVAEFYFPDDMRRDAARQSEAFQAYLSEAEGAFGAGSATAVPVIDFRRR